LEAAARLFRDQRPRQDDITAQEARDLLRQAIMA
jgi:hypothetical protein